MGRTVIDSLVLELGFDTQGMDKGRRQVQDAFKKTREEAGNTGKSIDEASKKSQQYLEKLRNNVVALFGVFTAGKGIKDFVSDVTSADAALGRFAKSIGQSARTIAEFRNRGSLLGISPGEMDSTFAAITNQIQDFATTGQSNGLIQTAYSLKLAVADDKGQPIKVDEFLDNVRNKFKELKLPVATQTNLLQRMGVSQGTIQLLESTDEVYNRVREDAKKLAAVQDADIGPAQERQMAWAKFKNTLISIGTQLLISLTPALLAFTNVLTGLAEFFEGHPILSGMVFTALAAALGLASIGLAAFAASSAWGAIVGGLTVIRNGVAGINLVMAILSETAIPALSEAFLALGVAIEATPVGWILTAIAAIGAAAFFLYSHWSTIKGWWSSLFGGMADDTEKAADRIEGAKKKMSEPVRGPSQPKPVSAAGSGANANATAWQAALDTEQKYGIPATVSYAQFMLESGGGKHMPTGSNNPFGIKANKSQLASGQFVEAMTTEHENGKDVRKLQKFAKFDSLGDAFEAHAKLLATSKYYAKARAVENDPDKFADALTGVYATDPKYGEKLKKLMHGDKPALPSAGTAQALAQATISAPIPVTVTNGQQAAINNNSSASSNVSSTETNIAQLHVHSAANNAPGIAGDIKQNLARDNFVTQSNSGPT